MLERIYAETRAAIASGHCPSDADTARGLLLLLEAVLGDAASLDQQSVMMAMMQAKPRLEALWADPQRRYLLACGAYHAIATVHNLALAGKLSEGEVRTLRLMQGAA